MLEKPKDFIVSENDIKEQGVQAIRGDVLYGEPDDNKKIFDRLVTFLILKYNSVVEWLVEKAHIHDNKELIDTIQEDNVHSHANKSIIDEITAENVHAHANKSILDTIEEPNVHIHNNKDVIDDITKERMKAWDLASGIPGGKLFGIATEIQALEGTDNETIMTPMLVKELYYQKEEVDVMIESAGGGTVVSDTAPPGDPSMLWFDTSAGGVAKYWDGTSWVAGKAVWG